MSGRQEHAGDASESPPHLPKLALAALGIVYGDIGTSPIYALRECFYGDHPVPPDTANVLGLVSLVFWALLVVISAKYLLYVMRADNRGEGGIVALVALLNPWRSSPWTRRWILMLLGLFGGALLYGDGTITPAISVLSALEGLKVATPSVAPFVVPATVLILIGLFWIQRHGTGRIGVLFGPIIALWFLALAALGVHGIFMHPAVLAAVNPVYAARFLLENGSVGFLTLGSVFLAVTGGEAMYADMGHFGLRPIRLVWFVLVLPALLLNYFGQAGLILAHHGSVHQPFYELAPGMLLYALVGLATLATIIASQAVISGVFSLTRQLIQLGQMPRMNVIQTSSEEQGQIYIPLINWGMMIATIALVLGFRTSNALASAYGIAVSATMVITTVLAYFVARRFGWSVLRAGLITAGLMVVDFAFLGANLFKIEGGGWYPLMVAVLVFTVMTTWARGRMLLRQQLAKDAESIEVLVKRLEQDPPYRIPGTAVFLTGDDGAPARLMHHLQRHRVLQENLLLVTVIIEDVPRVPANERMEIIGEGPGINRIRLRYGFMQQPNIPVALKLAEHLGLPFDLENMTYYVGRETLIPDQKVPGMATWRDRLFSFMSRNAMRATVFYGLPPEDVVELGFQIRI